MSDKLEKLWYSAKDLKHDAHSATNNHRIHELINDLIDEIDMAMSEESEVEDSEVEDLDFDWKE